MTKFNMKILGINTESDGPLSESLLDNVMIYIAEDIVLLNTEHDLTVESIHISGLTEGDFIKIKCLPEERFILSYTDDFWVVNKTPPVKIDFTLLNKCPECHAIWPNECSDDVHPTDIECKLGLVHNVTDS